jgi:glucose/arabinose dehydrogenase
MIERGAVLLSLVLALAGPMLAEARVEVSAPLQGVGPFDAPRALVLPPGFRVAAFAAGIGSPRHLAFSRRGVLFSADLWGGRIVAHPDRDGDGASSPAEAVVFASGLWNPHSLFWDGDGLYVGAHDRVLRFVDADGDLVADGPPATIAELPTFGDQITRTVVMGTDRRLYVGVGSTSDHGEESDPRRAAILRLNLDGGNPIVFASGLRNPVGLAVHPTTGALWTTEIGIDILGDDHPLEELNIVREGGDYGFPYCFEDRQALTSVYGARATRHCASTIPPIVTFPAHTTPLGLLFYTAGAFPPEFRGRAFVTLRGSSKRTFQAGYGVVTVRIGPNGEDPVVEPFASGWLLDPTRHPDEPGQHWGRPVGLAVGPDGALYVSTDRPGAIYKIWHEEKR